MPVIAGRNKVYSLLTYINYLGCKYQLKEYIKATGKTLILKGVFPVF